VVKPESSLAKNATVSATSSGRTSRRIGVAAASSCIRSGAATRDYNALRWLLDNPSQHVWITFEDGCMWWCTVRDRVEPNPRGQDQDNGHFWLACDRPWSNHSLGGRVLAITDLPGQLPPRHALVRRSANRVPQRRSFASSETRGTKT
jgi:hypothetical protein